MPEKVTGIVFPSPGTVTEQLPCDVSFGFEAK